MSGYRVQRQWRCASLAALAGLCGVSHAASDELSLAEAMRVAATQAPLLRAQRARIEAARLDAARAGELPDPRLMVGIDNLTLTGAGAFELGADEMTMRRIGLMQDWPSRAKREAQRALAEAELALAQGEHGVHAQQVRRMAAEAWLELWSAQIDARRVDELMIAADRAVEVARAQLASATGDAAAALKAQAGRAELALERSAAQARVQSLRAALARWLGEAALAQSLAAAPDFSRLPVGAERLRAALDQQAAVVVRQRELQAASAAVDVARASKRPEPSVAVAYGARSAGLPDMLMVEISVDLPLFANRRQDRDIAARIAERDAAEAEQEDTRRALRATLERNLALWRGLVEQQRLFDERLLPLARDRSATALASLAGGGSFDAWLDAQRDEIALQRRALDTTTALGRVWIELATLLPEAEVQP